VTTVPQALDRQLGDDDVRAIDELRGFFEQLRTELAKVIVGQDDVIEQLSLCLFARGHALLMGVPGLAKTLLVSCLAQTFELSFSRIQFTPDLMPMDITGTDILQEVPGGKRQFEFVQGPVFAHVVLADEINRAPSKTQAAMLEAMQEHKVTVVGRTFQLAPPFMVLATQNPIEQEGTYPLPEAQQDRFMFKVFVNYPKYDEEYQIAEATTAEWNPRVDRVLNAAAILSLHGLVRRIPVAPHVIHYSLRLVRATRVQEGDTPDFIREWVSWGAGPRAVQYLLLGGKARAALEGRTYVNTDDVRAVAHPVLRHRIITNFHAESEGVKPDHVVDKLLECIPEAGRDEVVDQRVAGALAS